MYVKSSQIAEELVSDVFFALWENRKQLVEITNFDAYIYRIAKFRVLKYLRDNKTLTVDLDEVPIELFAFTETTPEDDYISRELIDALMMRSNSYLPSQNWLLNWYVKTA